MLYKKCSIGQWIFILLQFFSPLNSLYAADDIKLPVNTVIEKVVCSLDDTQSYALFLPPDYSTQKKWPIIYALDPGARGKMAVELFQKAATKYGYIVVCSNNSQNGPWEPIVRAVRSVWDDTHSRFNIDEKRVYSAGFSGGARSAAMMTQLYPGAISVCIMCGAGLPAEVNFKNFKSVYFIGVTGVKDFNFIQMMDLKQKMNKEGIAHRIIITEDYHSWPEEGICTRIIEWLELQAMATSKAAKNEDLIDELYDKELGAGRDWERKKNYYQAYFHYSQILPLFKDLRGTSNLERRMEKAKDNEEYYRQSMNDLEARQIEIKILGRIYPVLSEFQKKPATELSAEKILKDLNFDSLAEFQRMSENPDMANMGVRLMCQIAVILSTSGWDDMEKQNYAKAIIAFEICRKTMENEPASYQAYYDVSLASAYGANNDSENALKYLKLGVEHGYKKVSYLLEAEYFKNIRERKEFKNILSWIK